MNPQFNIAFYADTKTPFDTSTPYHQPLGGSESALCYLASELSTLGHNITLYNNFPRPRTLNNITHLPIRDLAKHVTDHHFLTFLNKPSAATPYQRFRKHTKFLLWTQHQTNQPATTPLAQASNQDLFSAFIFVSHWQQEQYVSHYNISRDKCHILRNAASPFFANLFDTSDNILSPKLSPPTFAYTSVPNRGLANLLDLFPSIHAQYPQVKLKVFSSMQVYQDSPKKDQQTHGDLYDRCRNTPGIDYIGSLPQSALAKQLKSILCLIYPNTIPETSCINLIEAMAAGCQVITTQTSALPETTAGFGTLIIPSRNQQTTNRRFIKATCSLLDQVKSGNHNPLADHLKNQVQFSNLCNLWIHRAKQWEQLFTSLISN